MWADNQALKLQRRAHIMWDHGGPKTVFIVKKTGSAKTTAKLKEIGAWSVTLLMLGNWQKCLSYAATALAKSCSQGSGHLACHACRLQQRGLKVLVERPVHRTEFPEYGAFDPDNDGEAVSSYTSLLTSHTLYKHADRTQHEHGLSAGHSAQQAHLITRHCGKAVQRHAKECM